MVEGVMASRLEENKMKPYLGELLGCHEMGLLYLKTYKNWEG